MKRLALCVAVFCGFLVGCSPAQRHPKDMIRIAIGSDLRSLEPGANRDTFTDDMMAHVVEGLVAYREDLSVAPVLAETISVSDDRMRYTFRLREGLLFHNGKPVTARDVVWNLDRILAEDSRFLCKNWYDGSEGLEIVEINEKGPLTVEIAINRPDALFLDRLANFQCLVGIVHPDSVDADGHWSFPVGTGPYRLTRWSKGRFVEMERFERYQARPDKADGFAGAKQAIIPRVRWMVIPDPASARAALLAGQIDVVSGIDANDLAELRLQDGVDLHLAPSLDWNALLVRSTDPFLADVNLRRAIAHAIDRERLAEAVTLGISKPNPSAISQTNLYHTAVQDEGLEYNPDLARQFLRKSGYRGETIILTTNRRFQHMFDNAVYIQAMLREVGINVELEVSEWSTQLSQYFAGDFQLMSFGYSARTDPVLSYKSFVGEQSKDGWAQWTSPDADRLLAAAITETRPEQRQRLFDDLHRLMLRDVPIVPLFNHYVIQATSDRLVGYRPWTANRVRVWGVSFRESGR